MSSDAGNLQRSVFSEECIFHSNEVFNKHNASVWRLEKPCAGEKVPVTSEMAMELRGRHEKNNWSLIFSKQPWVVKNTKRMPIYYAMVKISDLCGSPSFQQECATPQWDINVQRYFDSKFLHWWIERKGLILWLAKPSDLIPQNIIIGHFVKIYVFYVQVQSLSHMKGILNKRLQL